MLASPFSFLSCSTNESFGRFQFWMKNSMDDKTRKNHKDTNSLINLLKNQNQTEFSMEFPLQISELPRCGLETVRIDLFENDHLETEVLHSKKPKDQSIPHLYFLRDDLLPLGLGSKWRKVIGILDFLKENQMDTVLLWGAIHGNYLASFTYILRLHGIKVDTVAYSRDPRLKTYNEQLVRGHSHTIECYASRKEAYTVWLDRQIDYSGLVLPEFGIHPGQIPGLHSLWEKLKVEIEQNSFLLSSQKEAPNQSKDTLTKRSTNQNEIQNNQKSIMITAILVLEVGSGATFLSAFDAFQGTSILVLGVMVGEPKEKWIPKVADLQKQLGLPITSIPSEQLITNQISAKFGKKNQILLEWIGRFYRYTNILLEPVYSGNTVNSILREIYEQRLVGPELRDSRESATKALDKKNTEGKNPMGENGNSKHVQNQFLKRTPSGEMIPIFYLHQGGQIQHLDLVLEEC
ncbi:hypothetical protein LEP1GSC199_1863 [Leptospira vanthielii serovar Holland str. Waz Holland = ATCC 700522]|uniref:1-aminocyclopropane-1-carboxylate deaminase n=2 Tax=Leptospira vanthielii TaxID=293085 RepID=N1W5M1_9LEPT|nr:hypothetical protein LEP1GSC199_1863 [Leptospira vanthielii serovar Holland str. Waz Holland = ATCC 700522]